MSRGMSSPRAADTVDTGVIFHNTPAHIIALLLDPDQVTTNIFIFIFFELVDKWKQMTIMY